MSKPIRKNAAEARSQLPALLADAEKGRATIITRHGRSIAAIVPAAEVERRARQQPLTSLSGSGKGLWGKYSATTLRRLRNEWSR
ncbi:MAG: type II toxin-antitoxin system Phd/YefM family antitoxin [Burkholderiales bacterium]